MLLLKIIFIIILSIIVIIVLIAIGFAAGIMRGLKIMSIKGLKRTPFEEVVVKKVFDGNPDVDPFLYSLYLKDKRKEEATLFKEEVVALKQQIADNKSYADIAMRLQNELNEKNKKTKGKTKKKTKDNGKK